MQERWAVALSWLLLGWMSAVQTKSILDDPNSDIKQIPVGQNLRTFRLGLIEEYSYERIVYHRYGTWRRILSQEQVSCPLKYADTL